MDNGWNENDPEIKPTTAAAITIGYYAVAMIFVVVVGTVCAGILGLIGQ